MRKATHTHLCSSTVFFILFALILFNPLSILLVAVFSRLAAAQCPAPAMCSGLSVLLFLLFLLLLFPIVVCLRAFFILRRDGSTLAKWQGAFGPAVALLPILALRLPHIHLLVFLFNHPVTMAAAARWRLCVVPCCGPCVAVCPTT
jgi:hypothetical protein